MDQSSNGHAQAVPLLGGQKPRLGTAFNAIIRELDENGTFEASGVMTGPNGQVVAQVSRDQYMDGNELIDEIRDEVRAVVREELAAFKRELLDILAKPS